MADFFTSPDIRNLRIGVCSVIFNSRHLGNTKEGVNFNYEPSFADVTADKYGSSPIDKVLTGETLEIEISLAEPNANNLFAAIGASDLDSGAAGDRLNIGRSAGFSLLKNKAAILVLHLVADAAALTNEDIVIYSAVPTASLEMNYEVDNQRIFKVTFSALIDETYGDGRRFGHIGLTNVS